jgi:hypothetical protein
MNGKERCVLAFACKRCDEVGEKTQIYSPTLFTLERIHGDDISINKG